MDHESSSNSSDASPVQNDRLKKKFPNPSPIYSVRMPVRWDSRTHKNRTDFLNFKTPTPIERVTQWVETDGFDEDIIYNSTLVRRDFSKFVRTSSTPTTDSSNSSGSPKSTLMTNHLTAASLGAASDLTNIIPGPGGGDLIKQSSVHLGKGNFLPVRYSTSNENRVPVENGAPVPVRLENGAEMSQKKFCYYLKLMEPLEKKETDFVKQRRSTRVKNLNLQQKKKQQSGEELLQNVGDAGAGASDSQIEDVRNHQEVATIDLTGSADEAESNDVLTLKSCRDLNMKIGQVEQEASIVSERSDVVLGLRFRFPPPPSQAFEEADFDNAIKRVISKYKQKIKNRSKANNNRQNGRISSNNISNSKKINTRKSEIKSNAGRPQKSITKPKCKHKMHPRNKTKDKLKKKPFKLVKPTPSPVKNINNKLKNKNSKSVVKKKKTVNPKINNNNESRLGKVARVLLEKRIPIVTRSVRKGEDETEIDREEKITEEQVEEEDKIIEKETEIRKPSPLIINNPESTGPVSNDFSSLELDNFDYNMLFSDIAEDMENLSEEHRRCLIESQIFSSRCQLLKTRPTSNARDSKNSLNTNESDANKKSNTPQQIEPESPKSGQDSNNTVEFLSLQVNYTKSPQCNVLKTEPVSSDEDHSSSSFKKTTVETAPETEMGERVLSPVIISDISEASDPSHLDYSYSDSSSDLSDDDDDDDSGSSPRLFPSPVVEEIDTNDIERNNRPVVRIINPPQFKSLHKSLTTRKRKPFAAALNNLERANSDSSTWESDDDDNRRKTVKKSKTSHSVTIAKEDGQMMNAFYVDYNLVVCQESRVSFWTQSALGNILGSQEMWVPKGRLQKLVLNDNSVRRTSSEMVISMENSLAYVELWTKEHKSDIREGPVADVFAIVYFWKQGKAPDKKALQLENIKGFGEDVQYVVLKSSPKIIVSWHSVMENDKSTYVRVYNLAADFQTVQDVLEIDPIKHYVSSLHNIQECESTLMGCGENKISLWNIEHGYIVATIEMNEIKLPLKTLWVKCDRGFLFMLQQCMDGELRLIAINALNQSWKKLQSYNPIAGFDSMQLKGACIEHGVLISYYDQGIVCWKAESGEPLVEELPNGVEYIPSGSHIIMETDGRVIVSHALTHLMCTDDQGTGESA